MKFLRDCLSGRHSTSPTKSSRPTPTSYRQQQQQEQQSRVKRHSKIHQSAVTCLARHWESHTVATGGTDGNATIFNYNTGRVLQYMRHSKTVTKVCVASRIDGIVTGCRDALVRLWKRDTSAPAVFSGHSLVVTAVVISPDNTRVISGSRDNCIKIWDVATGNLICSITENRNLITDMKLSDNILVQTSEDKRVRIWDTRNLDLIHAFPFKNYIQTSCDISPNGNLIVSGSNGFNGSGCHLNIWDIRNRTQLHELRGHLQGVNSVAFLPAPSSRTVFSASKDSVVKAWNLDLQSCFMETRLAGMGSIYSLLSYEELDILCGTDNGCSFLEHSSTDDLVPTLMF